MRPFLWLFKHCLPDNIQQQMLALSDYLWSVSALNSDCSLSTR